jgi:UDP-hydrolysing UDP-N-acetyl-D-glucosamine 2-epimerase
MSVHVLSVTSGRADVAILSPVWRALAAEPGCRLSLFATGMHCAPGAPPLGAVPDGVAIHRGGADLGGVGPGQAARAAAAIAADMAGLCERLEPDVVLVMGDRLDMLPAAMAALPFNLPLAHIHGGELTFGALDDRARHALTKMAHLHFASHVEAARRLVRMGEEPWRVLVTGGPGLDQLASVPALSAADFAAALGAPLAPGYALVTVHPETNARDPAAPMRAVLQALESLALPCLVTAPNSDPGGSALAGMVRAFLARNGFAAYRDTLGPALYANALRHAGVVLGNSSSGLIEAGFLGRPAVDVGGRQHGRPAGDNVRRVPADAAQVASAVAAALAAPGRVASPYGDGRAAPRIARHLAALPSRERLLYKLFHDGPVPDIAAPWLASATHPG